MKINPEIKPHKIAAIFDDADRAEQAENTLIDSAHFNRSDVQLIKPGDPSVKDKLEPETSAIGKTLINTHLIFGGMGLLLGFVLASIVSTIGPTFAQSSPVLTYLALGMIGSFFGLFVAGAVTLRPDHDPLINETVEATRNNQWALVVQARDRGDQKRARQLLKPIAISVTDTF